MKLILASSSPRRSQILKDAGFEFEVLKKHVDESFPENMPVRQVPLFLAKKKMQEMKNDLPQDAVIITADTAVILGDEIINKPADRDDAFAMLKKLSGRMHEVISGVCISAPGGDNLIEDITKVYFETLTDAEINYYLDTCQPYDKAGAYAIQEWIGLNKIAKIEGDYYNVVGFPMNRVYKVLKGMDL